MIIEISVAAVAAAFVLILIRLYILSLRIEDTIKRLEELLLRSESDLMSILHDTRGIVSKINDIVAITKHGTSKIDYAIERAVKPLQTCGILLKAAKVGVNTFIRKERR